MSMGIATMSSNEHIKICMIVDNASIIIAGDMIMTCIQKLKLKLNDRSYFV